MSVARGRPLPEPTVVGHVDLREEAFGGGGPPRVVHGVSVALGGGRAGSEVGDGAVSGGWGGVCGGLRVHGQAVGRCHSSGRGGASRRSGHSSRSPAVSSL